MAAIEIFKNESFGEVRVAGTSEEPLFCLVDVCRAIGISNSRNVKDRLDNEDVRLVDTPTAGGVQSMVYVTEAGMYDAVLKSDSPKARPFSRWITHEVLISLRKHGSYSVKEYQNKSKREPSLTTKVRVGLEWVKGVSELLNLNDSSKLSLLGKVATPLGLPTPDYTPSKGVVKSATELLKEKGLSISAQAFNQRAIQKGFLCEMKRKSSHGKDKPFKSITESGLLYGENQVNPNNPKSTQPLWYEDKFIELLGLLGFQLAKLA